MTSTIEDTLDHALFLCRHLKHCDFECATIAVLMELGVPTKSVGFDYLKPAVILFRADPTQVITKELYPAVGKAYGSNPGYAQIERGIRRAISEAWKSRDESIWKCYFPSGLDGNIGKPTNAEFISRVARFLELWHGCREEINHG